MSRSEMAPLPPPGLFITEVPTDERKGPAPSGVGSKPPSLAQVAEEQGQLLPQTPKVDLKALIQPRSAPETVTDPDPRRAEIRAALAPAVKQALEVGLTKNELLLRQIIQVKPVSLRMDHLQRLATGNGSELATGAFNLLKSYATKGTTLESESAISALGNIARGDPLRNVGDKDSTYAKEARRFLSELSSTQDEFEGYHAAKELKQTKVFLEGPPPEKKKVEAGSTHAAEVGKKDHVRECLKFARRYDYFNKLYIKNFSISQNSPETQNAYRKLKMYEQKYEASYKSLTPPEQKKVRKAVHQDRL